MLLALIVLAATILIAIQMRRPTPVGAYVGLPLPPLHASGWLNTDGPLTTADLAGKVVLVDYWATWCGPCMSAMPKLVAFQQRFQGTGMMVVGLTSEDGAALEQVRNVAASRGMVWPIGYGAGPTFQMMGIRGIPMYVLYDRSGTSVWGGHSLAGLEEAVIAALAKTQ
jgi:cytochrome c biogenesis protein CcmG, thiol:disulfide interchange protein DsbE